MRHLEHLKGKKGEYIRGFVDGYRLACIEFAREQLIHKKKKLHPRHRVK